MNLRREVLDSMAIEYRTTRHVEEIKRLRERLATFDADAEKPRESSKFYASAVITQRLKSAASQCHRDNSRRAI
jgi:hypothetical protein